MSDLSRLLGDVYGASTPPPADDVEPTDATTSSTTAAAADDPPAPPVEQATGHDPDTGDAVDHGATAPGWADDRVLDEAFAEWVPGPPADASAEERGMLEDVEPAEKVAEAIDIDAWLFSEQDASQHDATGPMGATAGPAAAAPVEAAVELDVADGPWARTSDDLLPSGRRGRRLLRR